MPQKKKTVPQRNATHILSYIMKIDRAIRNGEYPNANKLNKQNGWNFSRSTLVIQMLPDNITVDSALINDEVYFISDPITKLEKGVFESILKATKTHRTLQMEYKTAQNKDGSVYLSFETNQLSQTASWILSFVGGAKALNPPELIAQVHEAARRILKN